MSHCSQTFSVDFLVFLLKRRHLKNWKKSANKFVKLRKSILWWKRNNWFWHWFIEKILIEKYVLKHLISTWKNFFLHFLSSLFHNFEKIDAQKYSPKWMILNVDFAFKLSTYISSKRFICLKWILKKSYIAGHSL